MNLIRRLNDTDLTSNFITGVKVAGAGVGKFAKQQKQNKRQNKFSKKKNKSKKPKIKQ